MVTSNEICHFQLVTTRSIAHLIGCAYILICVDKFDRDTGQAVMTYDKM